jgi:ribosomal protein L19E
MNWPWRAKPAKGRPHEHMFRWTRNQSWTKQYRVCRCGLEQERNIHKLTYRELVMMQGGYTVDQVDQVAYTTDEWITTKEPS